MARDHMTQLAVAVNVLMLLSLVSTHSASLNLLVHSTEWHLQGLNIVGKTSHMHFVKKSHLVEYFVWIFTNVTSRLLINVLQW